MDNQFATEIILENGKALKFDDIGCMYKWMEINPGEKTKENLFEIMIRKIGFR